MVINSWTGLKFCGWAALVLKEKLKGLKVVLKDWNKNVLGNLKTKREAIVQRINELDVQEEEAGLSEADRSLQRELNLEFWQVLWLHESLLCQKARFYWLAHGDQNSSFFRSTINWKRRSNSVVGLLVDGVWEEDPVQVKGSVKKLN